MQENLRVFLQAELEVARTMLTVLRSSAHERKRHHIAMIHAAVDTVRHFQNRLEDQSLREELLASADELEQAISGVR